MPDPSLDPSDWSDLRALGHRMLDDMFDDLQTLRDGPVWQPMPDPVRAAWAEPLPRAGADPEAVYADFRRLIAPYGVGNRHPGFSAGCMAAAPPSACWPTCWPAG